MPLHLWQPAISDCLLWVLWMRWRYGGKIEIERSKRRIFWGRVRAYWFHAVWRARQGYRFEYVPLWIVQGKRQPWYVELGIPPIVFYGVARRIEREAVPHESDIEVVSIWSYGGDHCLRRCNSYSHARLAHDSRCLGTRCCDWLCCRRQGLANVSCAKSKSHSSACDGGGNYRRGYPVVRVHNDAASEHDEQAYGAVRNYVQPAFDRSDTVRARRPVDQGASAQGRCSIQADRHSTGSGVCCNRGGQ